MGTIICIFYEQGVFAGKVWVRSGLGTKTLVNFDDISDLRCAAKKAKKKTKRSKSSVRRIGFREHLKV